MTAFEIFAKLGADTSAFDSAMSDAEKSGKSLKNSLENTFSKIKKVAAGAISVAAIKKGAEAIINLATETSSYGDKIDKQSQALGMSRKAYQEWDYILGQNGASIESMSTSMKTLNSLILSAQDGSKEAKDSFVQLGLGIHELDGLSQEDQFEAVVRAFQKMPASAQKSALAVKMFGRNGMELLPLLNSSSTSIDELRQKAEELGLIMSDQAIDAAADYNDAMDTMQRTFNGIKYAVGAKLMPALTNAMTSITGYAGKIRKAYDEKGLKGVFETLVADVKNIKWPTWSDVQNAITTAWNTIVDGVTGLAKIIFGENVDGSIDWPTWEEIGAAIGQAWQGLVDGVKGLGHTVGKLLFGENADGTIDWPTWEEIGAKIQEAWKAIVQGVKDLGTGFGKVVFGENVDGTVKWPTWEEIGSSIEEAWRAIVAGVQNLGTTIGKAVFGENVDGTVKWPTWEEIGSAIETAWKGIVDGVKDLGTTIGKVIFGENVDGTVKWPTWEEIGSAIETAWKGIVDGVKNLGTTIGKAVFGENVDGTVKIPTWDEISKTASEEWQKIKEGIAALGAIAIDFSANLLDDWFTTIKGWLDGTGLKQIAVDFGATVAGWFSTIKGWLDDTGLKQISIDFGATVADWINRIWNWITSGPSITIDFGAKIAEWITRIWNWAQNGLNVAVNFLSGAVDNKGTFQGGTPSGLGWGETFDVPSVPGWDGFAKGINYVPRDNFPALLHRGEQVLTASQARKRNRGGTDLFGLRESIVAAMREGMEDATVNSYMDGRRVTNNVNRNTMNRLKARRFSPA